MDYYVLTRKIKGVKLYHIRGDKWGNEWLAKKYTPKKANKEAKKYIEGNVEIEKARDLNAVMEGKRAEAEAEIEALKEKLEKYQGVDLLYNESVKYIAEKNRELSNLTKSDVSEYVSEIEILKYSVNSQVEITKHWYNEFISTKKENENLKKEVETLSKAVNGYNVSKLYTMLEIHTENQELKNNLAWYKDLTEGLTSQVKQAEREYCDLLNEYTEQGVKLEKLEKEFHNLAREGAGQLWNIYGLTVERDALKQAETDLNAAIEKCQAEKSELKVMLELALWIISQHVIKEPQPKIGNRLG